MGRDSSWGYRDSTSWARCGHVEELGVTISLATGPEKTVSSSEESALCGILVFIVILVEHKVSTHCVSGLSSLCSPAKSVHSSHCLCCCRLRRKRLQHGQANTTHVLDACLVPTVDATCDRCCTVVVQVIVEGTITCSKALVLEEEWVVKKSEGVEDIKVGLVRSAGQ